MSGLTNNEILGNTSLSYLLAVMILVVIVLVYQVYYILLPKLTKIAKVVGVDGFGPSGPSHLSLLTDRGPAGTVGLYLADNDSKSGFFGGSETPVFYPEGDENAYRQYRNGDSNASYTYFACPPGVVLNADGTCPGGLVEMTGGTSAQIAAQQAANRATVKVNRNYQTADGVWVSCGKNMKVNPDGNGCIEGIGPSWGTDRGDRIESMTSAKKIDKAMQNVYGH